MNESERHNHLRWGVLLRLARAKGMAEIASQTGLSREQLYRSFSAAGNPTLKTTMAVMKALGVSLAVNASCEGREIR